jgi:hypothetical protein
MIKIQQNTMQQSSRDDDNRILEQTNKVKQQSNQSYSKPGMNATVLNNIECFVISDLRNYEIYFEIESDLSTM